MDLVLNSPDQRQIGERLRQRRRELGLTQIELSERLGHRGSTRLNQIELGRVRLYADELVIICRELNCSPMHILTEGLAGTVDCPMTLFARLPAERQRLVLDLMRELSGEPGHRQLELHKRLNELTDDQIAHIEAIVSDILT